MTQAELFYDDIHGALRATVEALGGAKRVGHEVWPALTVTDAEKKLLNCLNRDHAQKLSMDELMLAWKLSRGKGIHILGQFIAQEFSYEFRVITPEEKQAAVIEQFNRVKGELAEIMRAMEKFS